MNRLALTIAFVAAGAVPAAAQVPPTAPLPARAPVAPPPLRPTLRASFYTNAAKLTSDSGWPEQTSAEFITTLNVSLPDGPGNRIEYGLDLRHAQPTAAHRDARLSIYDGFVGVRLADGAWRVRGGQMWLNDLGGLGAVAGGLVEYRQIHSHSALGQFRAGGFAGIEPRTYDFGYLKNVRKYGAYAGLDGGGGRRHTVGYVRIDHDSLTERSVMTVTNFVPVQSRIFVYQSADYDITGPAGQGAGGLTYLFVNARVSPVRPVDVQGIFSRGRSIDARTITEDVLNGRPVTPSALDGLLYESMGGRVTVEVLSRFRVYGGYTRDRNNRDSAATGRLTYGASTPDLAGSGFDVTVTNTRMDRPTGRYDSLYLSGGRQLGRSVYVSADYSTSVSIVRYTRSDGLTIELQPHTRQLGGSVLVNLWRTVAMHVMLSDTRDDETRELRVLAGMTLRK
jgi:hypothetical protein